MQCEDLGPIHDSLVHTRYCISKCLLNSPGLSGGMYMSLWGFPGGNSGEKTTNQFRRCRSHGFDPWVGKIPWRRVWQSTPIFSSGESPWTEEPGGLQSMMSQRVRHD